MEFVKPVIERLFFFLNSKVIVSLWCW